MEVFQFIGIIVSALLIYGVFTLFIAGIATAFDIDAMWPLGWFIGCAGFVVVSYCWITNVPFPF